MLSVTGISFYKELFVAPVVYLVVFTHLVQTVLTLCLCICQESLPQPWMVFFKSLSRRDIVLLISFGAENAGLQLGAAAATPAAGCDAHAALCRSLAVAVNALQPLPVWLALCAFWSVVDAPCWGAGGRLGGDGAQQVVPLPQEVAVCAQAEAAFTEHHACAAGLGWPRAVVVLQLGQMSRISLCDELLRWAEPETDCQLSRSLIFLQATHETIKWYLALVLHLLGGSTNDVYLWGRETNGGVDWDVFGWSVASENLQVCLEPVKRT